jgi:hypothetical protein
MLSLKGTMEADFTGLAKKVRKGEPRTLSAAGAYVRAVAKNSIKTRKNRNKKSRPGAAPFSHPDSKGMQGFKKTIVFGVDKYRRSVVIGPKKVTGGITELARVHEFGGSREVSDVNNKFLTKGVEIGDIAPVRQKHLTKKDVIVKRDAAIDPLTRDAVFWIRIRTQSQTDHSRRLYRRMFRALSKKVKKRYPARPYMRPALKKSSPSLSRFWVGTIK